ncbi:Asp-tRNA(Asn)/Glu-tRNA(Gln) amidotransferase subunit GatA [Paraliomyxa miuraensis]|uniref:Asp-tRNA(Asn)/Glu-tRNA(Gln) amidotransferase subunit GatA n=1 Tax=Paraliomyxa miuraensis TaxID=376150 RepID=UPI002250A674|nr:Asp-tRNA(Asn)/Glu-tRNA(Gln) amidotransferase subunit GatA [Paraliomyxa miuraensis]MCX4246198.1 Asp-tRNA(Asn)/Glu-tRNA(Gln) amidotransferase subunit GatA [Paraliomyxa miuraensis]
MTPNRIIELSARAIARHVREGSLRATEVLEAFEARADATEPVLHAYLLRARDEARTAAEAIDGARAAGHPLGALAGVPIGLKDLFVIEGMHTRAGSRILEGWIPPYQGTHAARLLGAGAVITGKLAMDEFAMGSSNENTPYEPVRNPWDPRYVPGGSSGGSAAAVAAGSCAAALGSDTGGSIRQPASLCGVVGLKPSYGRVSRHGMIAFASSLDQAGPIARDVRDAAALLQVLAGPDPLDATCVDAPVPDYLASCDRGAAGLRVGVHREALASEGLDPEVAKAFEHALAVLQDAGATLVDVELPHAEHAIATYYVLCTAEAASNLARYDGLRYGARIARASLRETYEATREAGFSAEVKRRILLGTFVLRKDSYAAYYGQAQKVRRLIARDYARAFEGCDLIASPVSPVPGFAVGERSHDPLTMYLSDVFTIGANLAGLAAISIPAGLSAATSGRPALPIGVQLMAPALQEPTLLAAAAAHEDATDHHRLRPPDPPRSATASEPDPGAGGAS